MLVLIRSLFLNFSETLVLQGEENTLSLEQHFNT